MTTPTDQDRQNDLPPYEAPRLQVLDAGDTETGPTLNPSELDTFLQAS